MNSTQLLTNPAAFYKDSKSRSLKLVVGVLVVVAITQVISTIPVIKVTMDVFSRVDGPPSPALLGASQALMSFIVIFVTWAGAAGIMYLLASVVYKTEGSFTDTLAVVGWAYLPQVLYAVIHLAIAVYLFTLKDIALESSYATAQAGNQAVNSVIEVPPHQLSHMLAFLFIAWGALIAAHGISHYHDLDLRKSRIIALIPVVLWFAFRIAVMASQGGLPIQ